MQSSPTPQPASGRREILTGLGLAAAAPLVLGITARPELPSRPAYPHIPAGPTVLLRAASLVLTMDPALGSGPLGTVENAYVLMRNGTIAAVGTGLRPRPAPGSWTRRASWSCRGSSICTRTSGRR